MENSALEKGIDIYYRAKDLKVLLEEIDRVKDLNHLFQIKDRFDLKTELPSVDILKAEFRSEVYKQIEILEAELKAL